jgi:hypothetical protein
MAAWLDEVAHQFVPMPDHCLRVLSIAEYFRKSGIICRALRIWVITHIEALPQVGFWPMRREVRCTVVRYPKLTIRTIYYGRRIGREAQKIVLNGKLPLGA